MSDGAALGEVRCYADLHEIMRARADALNISRQTIDEVAGLQSGYASKLLAPMPAKKIGGRTVGAMLGPVLAALGLKLVAVEDADAVRKLGPRMDKRRDHSARHTAAVSFKLSTRFLRKIGRKGGALSRSKMTKRRARALARKAGRAGAAVRWHKPKLVEITNAKASRNMARVPSTSLQHVVAGSAKRRVSGSSRGRQSSEQLP